MELFLYIVFLTPGVIGSLAGGWIIHCVLSFVRAIRKKPKRGYFFGISRTFIFAVLLQLFLFSGSLYVAESSYPPIIFDFVFKFLYMSVLSLPIAAIAWQIDKNKRQSNP